MLNYEVFWDSGSGATPRTLLTTTTNTVFEASTTLAIADLVDGKTYQFAVRAVNTIGESQYSSTTAIIAATVPDQPEQPTVTTASSASVQIEWTEPGTGGSPIQFYHVYEAVGSSVTESDFVFVMNTGTTRSYSKSSGVTPGELYHFKVLAINLVGSSILSNPVSRLAAAVPNPPVNL